MVVVKGILMLRIRKYWWHLNIFGIILTFLFAGFLTIWGVNAIAPYDRELDVRVNQSRDMGVIRAECLEINARAKFAYGAGISLGKISVLFLCLVFLIFILNIRFIQNGDSEGQVDSLHRDV